MKGYVVLLLITARGPRLNRATSLGNQTGRYERGGTGGREQEWAGHGHGVGVARRKYWIKRGEDNKYGC